ncbi:MAG: hypothetical protein AAF662_04390 [Pseudomonadota bacterium]
MSGNDTANAARLVPGPQSIQASPDGDSNETHQATSVANQGSAGAAGVMPGAVLVSIVIQMLQRGSVSQVESGHKPSDVRCKAVAARSEGDGEA